MNDLKASSQSCLWNPNQLCISVVILTRVFPIIPRVILTKTLAKIPVVILTKIPAKIRVVNLTKILPKIPLIIPTKILAKIALVILTKILTKVPVVILAKIPVANLTKIRGVNSCQDFRSNQEQAIVQDPTGILWNLNQFWKRSYSIIDKTI